ncbi:hypothetical protein [Sphingomonas psychrotolerans]|uniref:hypothetical protein n=1 Tax=Sphingomonas psychrotolerans TaxID=1327635 RepID=UPI001F17DF9C|nr:hypothetical protein [Sphingomonas psychrotolerans]
MKLLVTPTRIELVFSPWLTIVADETGEHAVLSHGWHHIRIDIEEGNLTADGPVAFEYRLHGLASAEPKILPAAFDRPVSAAGLLGVTLSAGPPGRSLDFGVARP